MKEPKIIGWEIQVYEDYGRFGRVRLNRCEYGNSPIRDRKSLEEEIERLKAEGADFEVNPIREGKYK